MAVCRASYTIAGAKNIRAKNIREILQLERATVILNLLARHKTWWSDRASERWREEYTRKKYRGRD